METISKASINTCSPYTILSKETWKVKEVLISTNVDTFIEDTVSGENMVEIEIAKHRVTAN